MRNQPRLLRWILLSLAVIAAVGVMIRLGFWQLDRLEQRRTFNAGVRANQDLPALDLNTESGVPGLDGMAYRPALARGEYITDEQVMLRNQVDEGRTGVHLLTPLKISGTSQAILVDRGWIPLEEANPSGMSKYDETGQVEVHGVLRRTQSGLRTGSHDTAGGNLIAVNVVDVPVLARQTSLPMLPLYLQEAPGEVAGTLPARSLPVLDLSEGPHAGYALQWFTFAALLAGGYPYFVYTHLRKQAPKSRINSEWAVSNIKQHKH